ncbi:MAG TPA: cupredoxin domain-containing protein [Acidimicrobiia bacterium]|nr:cupredoxin domain-containing protein [Acidimicrobiia bacterium]
MRRGLGVLTMVGVLALAACGGSDGGSDTTAGGGSDTTAGGGSDTTAAEGGETASVSIVDFEFSAPASVAAGAEITVVNNGEATHTWTEPNGAFDTGRIAPGSSATVTIDAPGTYDYVCSIHSSMTGTIEVTEA